MSERGTKTQGVREVDGIPERKKKKKQSEALRERLEMRVRGALKT